MKFILATTFIFGLFLTGAGVFAWSQTWGSSYNNLNSTGTGAIVGWDPVDSTVHPSFQIGIQPFLNNTLTSALIFVIGGTINTNKTFTFGFISPFKVLKLRLQGSQLNGGAYEGNWSYQNVGNLGSVIHFQYRIKSSLRGDFLTGNAVFYVTNVPVKYDRGSYTVFIPFGAGLTWQFQQSMNMTHFFTYVSGRNFEVYLDIPLGYTVINSYPPFVSNKPQLNVIGGIPIQSLGYEMNGTTGLSVTYEDSGTVNNYVTLVNIELFTLALGVPLVLSSALEIAKYLQPKEAGSAPPSQAWRLDFEEDQGI